MVSLCCKDMRITQHDSFPLNRKRKLFGSRLGMDEINSNPGTYSRSNSYANGSTAFRPTAEGLLSRPQVNHLI
jgi:hypothetical protein